MTYLLRFQSSIWLKSGGFVNLLLKLRVLVHNDMDWTFWEFALVSVIGPESRGAQKHVLNYTKMILEICEFRHSSCFIFFGGVSNLAVLKAYSWLWVQRSLLVDSRLDMVCWKGNPVGCRQAKSPTHSNILLAQALMVFKMEVITSSLAMHQTTFKLLKSFTENYHCSSHYMTW